MKKSGARRTGARSVRKDEQGPVKPIDITGIEGKWAVLVDDKIVAASDDLGEILERADEYPPGEAIVTKLPNPGLSFY